jgi:hypothetical protein
MNASAQRISIKSLDMQRQSFQGKPVKLDSKQTFPEVISFLNNPFTKNNMNYSVKH